MFVEGGTREVKAQVGPPPRDVPYPFAQTKTRGHLREAILPQQPQVAGGQLVGLCGKARRDEDAPEKARTTYSMTSSARASNIGEISSPMDFAVCRLMMNSNLVA